MEDPISDSCRTAAFSAVRQLARYPGMPGRHQPAPMVGTVLTNPSTIESDGLEHDHSICSQSRHPWPPHETDVSPGNPPGSELTAGVLSLVWVRFAGRNRRGSKPAQQFSGRL